MHYSAQGSGDWEQKEGAKMKEKHKKEIKYKISKLGPCTVISFFLYLILKEETKKNGSFFIVSFFVQGLKNE